MFFSRAVLVVFKTTGGKAWNPPGGLRPLSAPQRRNRKENVELTLKNMSILKMAAANEPETPTRLYKSLEPWRLAWMKRKMSVAEDLLQWKQPVKSLQAKVDALRATSEK